MKPRLTVTRTPNGTYLAQAFLGNRLAGQGVDRSEAKAKARAMKQAVEVQQLISEGK